MTTRISTRGIDIDPGAIAERRRIQGTVPSGALAWIRVVDRLDHPEKEVRIDLDDRTVARVRELFDECVRCENYRRRARDPGNAIPQEAFLAARG